MGLVVCVSLRGTGEGSCLVFESVSIELGFLGILLSAGIGCPFGDYATTLKPKP